jgi:radical SAM superfamily enzyme YgiQ (UPF0313 family)
MITLVKYGKMSEETFKDIVRLYEISELAGEKWIGTSHTKNYRRCHTLVMHILSTYDKMKLFETDNFKKTWAFQWQNTKHFPDSVYKDDITLLVPEEHQAEFSTLAKKYRVF